MNKDLTLSWIQHIKKVIIKDFIIPELSNLLNHFFRYIQYCYFKGVSISRKLPYS